MGYRMAGRMSNVQPINVWNRNPIVSCKHSLEYNSNKFDTIEQLSEHSDIVFTCLPSSHEVEQIIHRIINGRVKIFIDCTSGNYRHTVNISDRLSKFNIKMMDCPVSGGPRKAEEGTLCSMVGGNRECFDSVHDVLKQFSKPRYVGKIGNGHAIKAINNMLNVSQLCLATAGLRSLNNIGIDYKDAVDVINNSSGRSLMTQERIPNDVLTERYKYGFSLGLMKKDLGLAMDIMGTESSMYTTLDTVYGLLDKCKDDVDYTEVTKIIKV